MYCDFDGYGVILAELVNGEQVECRTLLRAKGEYRKWFEPEPVEWIYGRIESEYEIDYDTVEILYPDEYTLMNGEDGDGILKKFIKEIDVEWEVVI